MKLGSLFDGSGGFPLAGSLCGIEPVWAAEVEPYPIAVTTSRFPNMKHLGSVTDINGAEIEPVDIITFGSPCQDLSVAGKRAGLKHEGNGDEETTRSGLFMEAIRIIKEMRSKTNGAYPTFALWENVPGAFSSNKGEDFRIVLEEFIKVIEPRAVMPAVPKNGWAYADSYCGDGWSIGYRVFDAQYWGVPQRRRRIYLVADFRGQRAKEILFEREGLRGYFAESRTPWQAAPADAEGSVRADDSERNRVINLNKGDVQSKAVLDPSGIAPSLYAGECRYGGGECYVLDRARADDREGNSIAYGFPLGFRPENVRVYEETATTICNGTRPGFTTGVIAVATQQGGKGGANYAEEVKQTLCSDRHGTPHAVAYGISSYESNSMKSSNPHSGIYKADTSRTLDLNGGNPACNQGGIAIVEPVPYTLKIRSGCEGGGKGALIQEDLSATLATNNDQYLFQPVGINGEVAGTLDASYFKGCGMRQGTEREVVAIPIHDQATRFSGKRGDKSDGKGNGLGVGAPGDPMNTLTSGDRHAVAYLASGKEAVGTLMANAGTKLWLGNQEAFSGDYHIIEERDAPEVRYIVRRLTPTECARLQGFPDLWGHPDHKEDFTDEEWTFWAGVRNTHAAINGKATKSYTREQMVKWYNGLHTDSAEYKMWGNGVALPCSLYVMQGIKEAANEVL